MRVPAENPFALILKCAAFAAISCPKIHTAEEEEVEVKVKEEEEEDGMLRSKTRRRRIVIETRKAWKFRHVGNKINLNSQYLLAKTFSI